MILLQEQYFDLSLHHQKWNAGVMNIMKNFHEKCWSNELGLWSILSTAAVVKTLPRNLVG